jgi:hypothetical protein
MWCNSISLDHNNPGTADRGGGYGRDLISWIFFALPYRDDPKIGSVKAGDLLRRPSSTFRTECSLNGIP